MDALVFVGCEKAHHRPHAMAGDADGRDSALFQERYRCLHLADHPRIGGILYPAAAPAVP